MYPRHTTKHDISMPATRQRIIKLISDYTETGFSDDDPNMTIHIYRDPKFPTVYAVKIEFKPYADAENGPHPDDATDFADIDLLVDVAQPCDDIEECEWGTWPPEQPRGCDIINWNCIIN